MVETQASPEQLEVLEWDINDPSLREFTPELDTEAIPVQLRSAPPPDGVYPARFKLGNRKEGSPVYIKGAKDPQTGKIIDGKVVAVLEGRLFDQNTGVLGAFLRTWWPTTQVFRGQTGSQLSAICLMKGDPIPPGSDIFKMHSHIERVFAEAGEEGIELWVRTRWVKSTPQFQQMVDTEGEPIEGAYVYVYDENNRQIYDEVKGEKKIKALMAKEGIAPEFAHIWYDFVANENRYVNAEVAELLDSSKFEHV